MKKFFIKYKQYFKKFLFSLPILIACFSLIFSLPVIAAGTTYNISFAQPLASDTAGYIECLMDSGDIYVYTFQSTGVKPDSAYVDVTPTSVTLRLNRSNATDGRLLSVVYSLMDTGPYYTVNSAVGDVTSMSVSPYVPSYRRIVSVKAYGFIRVYASGGVSTSNNFQIIYGADVVVSNQINTLISIITNQNTQIIDNADKNASEIQANADKNSSEIQANADKNTDIITNGGSDYGTVDKDTSNDYMSKEQELDSATSMSRENTVSLFSNFGSFFLNSKLAKGLTGTTAIMKEFFGISWLSDMANFGLILGAFAFVIGAGVLAGGIHRQKVSSERRSSRGGK